MAQTIGNAQRVISAPRVCGYCWQTDDIMLYQVLSPRAGPPVVRADLFSGARTRLPGAERLVRRHGLYRPLQHSQGWLLWHDWDSITVTVYAYHLASSTTHRWKTRYEGVFAGSLLASPDTRRWTLLTQRGESVLVTTGFPDRPRDLHQTSLGLPPECAAGWSGNGAKLLDTRSDNRIVALGLGGYFPRQFQNHLPLFSFEPLLGRRSLRSEPVPFVSEGSLEEIAYSARTDRLATWENLPALTPNPTGASPRRRFRLTTRQREGRDVRVLGEFESADGYGPTVLRWSPAGTSLGFLYDETIWRIPDRQP